MSSANAFEGFAARRRTARNVFLVSALLLETAACAVQPPQPRRALVEIDSTNSTLWLRADEAKAYRCRIGLLECHDVVGRLGARQCRCVE